MKRPLLLVMRVAIFCSFKMSQVTTSLSLLDTKRAKFVLYQKTLKISNLPLPNCVYLLKGTLGYKILLKGLKVQQKFNDTRP